MWSRLNINDPELRALVQEVHELEEERINYMCDRCNMKQQCRCEECAVAVITIE